MDTSKLVYWISFILGIILCIFGMFDLTPTKFGYNSPTMNLGLFYLAFGYVCMKLYYLKKDKG